MKDHEPLLMPPWQPLSDNLTGNEYHAMMSNPVKYALYQQAIEQAVFDRMSQPTLTIYVAGAGFGGLVHRVVRALNKIHLHAAKPKPYVTVMCIEKNPLAVRELRRLATVNAEWRQWQVGIHAKDMRQLDPPCAQVDILVSELLGGFADNELAPECLAGFDRYMSANGVSIPSATTSYIAPVNAPHLHSIIADSTDPEKNANSLWVLNGATHAGVLRLCDPQSCFHFEYPTCQGHNGFERDVYIDFGHQVVQMEAHGLVGFFTAHLYGDIMLSTLPKSHTVGLYEWLPVFFPLAKPMPAPPQSMQVSRRYDSSRGVWYQWRSHDADGVIGPWQNRNGKWYTMALH